MRKQQAIQLLQFILAWILLWLFVIFVMEKSFIDFILRYRLYLLIVSISYFYYYSIEYEPDKKYKLIRNIIIYGNLYLFLHIFFRPLLNISHQLFVLLWLIILWMWRSTTLKSRWKYLLQIVGWVFSFFILISGMFYFYPEEPDIKWFIESKNNEIRILWASGNVEKWDAYIKINNLRENEDFNINSDFSKALTENVKISYPSLNQYRDEKIIITTSYWDLVQIFPQSEISLEFSWKNLQTIKKLNWKIWFLSWIFESNIKIVWIDDLWQEEQTWLIWAQDIYKQELVYYLKKQISESRIWLANNTIMYNIDGIIIKILSKMFPVTFSKNMENYNEFQKYFSRTNEELDLWRFSMRQLTWESISSFWWSIQENIDVWKNNTYGWFKKPKNR